MDAKEINEVKIDARIPKSWHEQIYKLAVKDCRSVSSIIRQSIKEYLDR